MKSKKLLVIGIASSCLFSWQIPIAVAQDRSAVVVQQIPAAVLDMKSLVEQGRFLDAFNLGLKNEQLTGDPLYDYYFGVAAVDSGRASLGVLALERVLLTNPGNDLARLELARGYFVLEDYERAREEFTLLLGKDLPAPVKASVQKYLGAIKDKDPEFRTVAKGYIEYAIGHNSNVNASADKEVPIPLFGQDSPPIFVNPGDAKSSALSQLIAGASISGPVIPGVKYFAGMDLSQRQHASVDNFDQTVGALNGGIEFSGDSALYRLTGYYVEARLDNDRLRDTSGVVLDWVKPVNKETSIRSSVGFAQLRYAGEAANTRDSDLPSLSVGFNTFLGGGLKTSLDGSLNFAREKNRKGYGDLARDIYGIRVALGFQPAPKWQGSLTYSFTNSDYDSAEPLAPASNTFKVDKLHSIELGLQYQLTKGWSVRGELAYSENKSNVDLYGYDQTVALLKMRYEWK